MQLVVHPLKLALKKPFTIAHGTFHYREAVVVELRDSSYSGFGEATAISYYGKKLATFQAILAEQRSFIERQTFDHPAEFWKVIHPVFKNHPFLLCALDVAAHDLWAKRLGLPLYQAWELPNTSLPTSNFTISIGTIDEMLAQMNDFPNPIYKIKLGTKEDVAIIRGLRKQSNAIFRVDANCAWSVEETLANAEAFVNLGVEFIEQPLSADNWDGMKILYEKSPVPLIADESCQTEWDIEKCHHHFHGVNIKLMKCGGFTPALRMIEQAKSLHMKVMCGCMTESSIGISAIAHLAPLLDYVDMDGALLLAEDPAIGVLLNEGKIQFSKGNGIGAYLKAMSNEQWARYYE
ncbi:MAG: dipeptide epimerase [Bacteroidota bacterium]